MMVRQIFISTLVLAVVLGLEGGQARSESPSEAIQSFLLDYKLGAKESPVVEGRIVGGALDAYVEHAPVNGSRFASYPEYLAHRIRKMPMAKMSPEEVSARLNAMADQAERATGSADSRAAALLARYHARKTLAGAGLALYYGTGDLSALRMARSNAAAALEVWERFVRLDGGADSLVKIFAVDGAAARQEGTACARYDLTRLDALQRIFSDHGIIDLGLDFGPSAADGAPSGAIRRIGPGTSYARRRGYGWFDSSGIESSPPVEAASCSVVMESVESVRRRLPLAGGYLRGSARSTLIVDLPDGEYRVTAIVANQAELASGRFLIRASEGEAAPDNQISYSPGETGDKSMDVAARGGRLALAFVPDPPGDWLASGMLITRRAPHIAHIPIFDASRGSRTNFSATVTAPDGVAAAELHLSFNRRNESIPLRRDGAQYEATVAWPEDIGEASYYFTATDDAGHSTRWPSGPPITTTIHHAQPAVP